ncbi:hypothetical protein AHiyo4_49760 [Arthrobacter sp. Hiyo4]|nr:hypothetical protein AHiyo4_49760 [Arthrobacter sp. Hiyo4]
MNSETVVSILCGLAILVGVAGTIIPILPGSFLIGLSLLAWAIWGGAGTTGWVVFAVGMVFVLAGMAASAVLTGRKLRQHSIPSRSVVIGLAAGVAGMFVIPVVGSLWVSPWACCSANSSGPGTSARQRPPVGPPSKRPGWACWRSSGWRAWQPAPG